MPAFLALLLPFLSALAHHSGEAASVVSAIGQLLTQTYPTHQARIEEILGSVLPSDVEAAKIDADLAAT